MARKTTSKRLRLNPNFNKTIDTNLNVWSHDENSYEFRFEFYDDECDIPIDLTDAKGRILLLFKNECDKKHLLDLEIEDETLGFAKFTVPKRILGYEGTVNAHIYIDFEGKTHDFGNFLFRMKRSAIDEDFPELDTVYVSEFEKALEEIQEILRKFDGVEMDIDEKIKQIEQAIEQHELEVEQKLNDINTSVDDRLTQINNNLDGTEEELNKRIDVIEKDIASNEVAKQSDVEEVNNKIDSIKIPNRNYMLNSETFSKIISNKPSDWPIEKGSDETGNWIRGHQKDKPDTFYINTFLPRLDDTSYFVKDTKELIDKSFCVSVDVMCEESVQVYFSGNKKYSLTPNKWTRIYGYNSKSNIIPPFSSDGNTASSKSKLYHKNWKVDCGNQETDWTPASEDFMKKSEANFLLKQIDELKNAITTLGGTL